MRPSGLQTNFSQSLVNPHSTRMDSWTINLDELKALKIPSQVSPRVCLTWQEWSCGFSKRFNPLSITGMKENKNHSNHLQPMVIRQHPVTCLTQNSVWRLPHFGQRLSPDVLTRSNKTMQPQWTGCENFPRFLLASLLNLLHTRDYGNTIGDEKSHRMICWSSD